MSASEKLKALDREATMPPWGWDERVLDAHQSSYYVTGIVSDIADDVAFIATLRNALPQIVALVEAAEREAPFEERGGNTGDLRAALTALEEALGGDVT